MLQEKILGFPVSTAKQPYLKVSRGYNSEITVRVLEAEAIAPGKAQGRGDFGKTDLNC